MSQTQQASIPMEICEQAAEWFVTLQERDVDAGTRERWREWRAAHADHERAWLQVEAFGEKLRGMSSPLAHATLAPANALKRRQAVKALAAVLLAGGAARYAQREEPWRPWFAEYRTGVGERRALTLADGTKVALNSSTALDVSYAADIRLVTMLEGEILVTTAHDPAAGNPAGAARPFVVNTAQGNIRALGTHFSVRQLDAAAAVSVFDGAVAIRPQANGAEQILRAGEQVQFTRRGIAPIGAADDSITAWADDMIVACDMPLQSFLAELGRHRPGRLGCDPAIAGLRVTGTYPLADTDKILMVLQDTLPVRVQRFSRYWVTLHQRDA